MEPESADISSQRPEETKGSNKSSDGDRGSESRGEWKKLMAPDGHRFSIGPRIVFLMATDKNERTEVEIGGLAEYSENHFIEDNWDFAAALWHAAEKFWSEDNTKRGFRTFLSTAQFHSFLMLREWLHSEYETKETVQEIYNWLYSHGPGFLTFEGQSVRDSHLASEEVRHQTLYQKVMADLFREEFSPAHWVAVVEDSEQLPKDMLFNSLDGARRLAWQARTAQRISWKFTYLSWDEGLDNCNKCSFFENPVPRMYYCPWLKRDRSRSGFPRYLWHITSKQTVDTLTFSKRADYTCISHTWGRWRKAGSISIPGVPWQVPLNSRFDVAGLPDVFLGLKGRFSTAYIWFDLFCIPQQTDDQEFASIKSEEIAKQAVIFQNAAACVRTTWLNYVHHWIGEYCTLAWLSAQYFVLSTQPGMYETEGLMKAAEHGCNLPLQLTRLSAPTFGYPPWRRKLTEASERLRDWWRNTPYYHFEPSEWFSGVWTLQEAYLRPNMIIADESWNVLCDASGEPVSLEELFVFDHVVWNLRSFGTQILGSFLIKGHGLEDSPVHPLMKIHVRDSLEEDCPPGPRQLKAAVAKTHLFSRSLGSRIDLLIQANGRFCTAGRCGRAEAIMSSLGITEWFKIKPNVEDSDLVLHMYPLEFLREAALKIGADFWLTSNESPSPWKLFDPFSRLAGTMLPLDNVEASRYRMRSITSRGTPPCGTGEDLHPSVASWQIQLDGSVRILKAAILGSNKEHTALCDCRVMLGFWGSRHSESQEAILSEWIATQPQVFDTFAVCLTKGSPQNLGLVLQGRRLGRTTKLVKVGFYVVNPDSLGYYAVPISQPVDWTVV